jgi:hypothetical protein
VPGEETLRARYLLVAQLPKQQFAGMAPDILLPTESGRLDEAEAMGLTHGTHRTKQFRPLPVQWSWPRAARSPMAWTLQISRYRPFSDSGGLSGTCAVENRGRGKFRTSAKRVRGGG